MNQHRALFIGGPIDGQERVLRVTTATIRVEAVVYQRLFAFGIPQVFIYSVYDVAETLLQLWNRYTGGKYADPC